MFALIKKIIKFFSKQEQKTKAFNVEGLHIVSKSDRFAIISGLGAKTTISKSCTTKINYGNISINVKNGKLFVMKTGIIIKEIE